MVPGVVCGSTHPQSRPRPARTDRGRPPSYRSSALRCSGGVQVVVVNDGSDGGGSAGRVRSLGWQHYHDQQIGGRRVSHDLVRVFLAVEPVPGVWNEVVLRVRVCGCVEGKST